MCRRPLPGILTAVVEHLLSMRFHQRQAEGNKDAYVVVESLTASDILPDDAFFRGLSRKGVFQRFPGLEQCTWDAFLRANREPQDWRLLPGFDASDAPARRADVHWTQREDLADGARVTYRVSIPGFSSGRRRALVCVAITGGLDGGYGEWLLLVERAGQWAVADHLEAWVD